MKTDDSNILESIKNSIEKEIEVDFCDELSPEEQQEINEAIKELDAGKGMEWNAFKASLK